MLCMTKLVVCYDSTAECIKAFFIKIRDDARNARENVYKFDN